MSIQENTTETNRFCKAIRKDGQPCKATALTPNGYCFAHSEELAAQRKAARSQGGKNSARSVRLDKQVLPKRLAPVYTLLEDATQKVYKGELEPSRGTSIAALSRAMVAVLEAGELEERVRDLEDKTNGGKR